MANRELTIRFITARGQRGRRYNSWAKTSKAAVREALTKYMATRPDDVSFTADAIVTGSIEGPKRFWITVTPDETLVEEVEENPGEDKEATQLAEELGREAVTAAGKRYVTKTAITTVAKIGGKTIPFVGEGLMAYEAGRSAQRDLQHMKKKRKKAAATWREGKKGEAASEFAWDFGQEAMRQAPRTAIAAATTAEIAEKFIPRENSRARCNCLHPEHARRNPITTEHLHLLQKMTELQLAYQNAHWNSAHYGDHLLFERLAKSLEDSIDTWAELLVGVKGDKIPTVALSLPTDLMSAENDLGKWATKLASEQGLPKSLENFLLEFIQNRRQAIYLLRQRG